MIFMTKIIMIVWSLTYSQTSWNVKLVEVMEFQLRYCKSWKMMLWTCCIQYASKFGKLRSGRGTGKGQFSFQPWYPAISQIHAFNVPIVLLWNIETFLFWSLNSISNPLQKKTEQKLSFPDYFWINIFRHSALYIF